MSEIPYIQVKNITQTFGTQEVLKGVSFDVHRGELLALIGGSGAGKSVILKHLIGLLNPLSGSVMIDGNPMSNVSDSKQAILRAKMGFMFQQGALFDSMTVAENIAFPLIEAGITNESEIARRVQEALDSVDLGTHGDKMPANLSGGMIKRVAVARAIVSNPECLFYDEPTAGLDPIVTDSVSYLIRKICVGNAITSIIVTHDMGSVIHIADRIIFLNQGRVYWEGTPEELLQTQDPFLYDFVVGHSGEDWKKIQSSNRPDFQKEMLQDALAERYHQS
ncbi:MAG: ATP-binding cassette domain-containing protein [Akkermansia sp.]